VLDEISVPFPPIIEQQQIVAAIETQFARLDDTVAALQRARTRLKRYRASVPKAACEGRLVPTEAELARREGRDYEPASVLLERIRAEREANAGKKRGKKKTAPVLDTSALPDLPEGWEWTTIGKCFEVYVGATPSRKALEYWNGGIPWVSSGEVAFCTLRSTRETISELGLRKTSTALHPPGTVLVGMIGEGKTRGQVAMLEIDACNNQNSAAIRASETPIHPWYVYRYLEGRYEETRAGSSGNNQPALNKSRVEGIPFPLPPKAETVRIVAEVERIVSVIEQLEATVETNLKRAESLRQSILRRAFSRRLVFTNNQRDTSTPPVLLAQKKAEDRSLTGAEDGN
jgi:type I restriction enzyme S subunit